MNQKHDKQKVLDMGLQLFWKTGYTKLGVDEICRTTGMTKGAFYHAFNGKEKFLLACIEAYSLMNVSFLTELLSGKEKAIDRLLNAYIYMFEEQPQNKFIGCMTNNMMSEIGSSNDVVSKATSAAFEKLLEVLVPVVQDAQKDGDITLDIHAKPLAELIHTTFFGALTRAKSTRDFQKGVETMTLLFKSLKSI